MASIHKAALINAPAGAVWSAVRDVGAAHSRLMPGFVTHTELVADHDPMVRKLTLADGKTVNETIVEVDDELHRLVCAVRGEGVDHHNGALQVFDAGPGRCRVTWIADLLPHGLATSFDEQMGQGLAAMKAHLEAEAGHHP
jgi:carbon monoxide dehydrogenase subunit G